MLNGFPDNFRMEDDEVLNEFRQKQVNFDLEEKKNEINNSRSLFIGALGGLVMAGIVGWFMLAPQYQGTEEEEVPVIRRTQEEVKVLPVDPGHIAISSQENTVYDMIDRKPENDVKIMPPSEQPNKVAIEALAEETAQKQQEKAETETQKEVVAESVLPRKVAQEKVAEIKREEPKQEVKIKSEPEIESQKAIKTETKAKEKVEIKPQKQIQKVAAAQGIWRIQLMSSPNKTAVEKSWKTMTAKYSILKGLPHEISSVNLGKKGIYYRLKAGNFQTKDEATAMCSKLKALGGNCFTSKK